MKFPRNARIFRGQLDAAPFATVFFLLVIFLWLGSLIYTPGVHIRLPLAEGLPGTDKPTIAVALGPNGQFYFDNQLIDETDLKNRLHTAVKHSAQPLTLVVHMDKAATWDMLAHLTLLARDAGISDALLATLPRAVASPGPAPIP